MRRQQRASIAGPEAGFTLVEVIAVLVIAAIVAGTVVFRTGSSAAPVRIKALAGTIAAGLRHSRGRAIKRGREIIARIDTDGSRISWGTERAPLALRPGIGIRATTAQSETRGRVAGIRFFPNGSSTGGRLQVSSGGVRYDVAVNWLTGHVSIERAE